MQHLSEKSVRAAVDRFIAWLDRYGETSYDHQSFFASTIGRAGKALYYRKPLLGTVVVAPLIFCEAFVPSARRFFWKQQRFPIADAHYASGFAFLAQAYGGDQFYRRARHFVDVLKHTRSEHYKEFAWGYPFDWETQTGTFTHGTPMITTIPYVYEAFRQVHEIDLDPEWRDVMHSIARHALHDYQDFSTSPTAASCSYSPRMDDTGGVVNAAAYRAFLLTRAALDFCDDSYMQVARRNLNFVVEAQNADGSWYYSIDGHRNFVDHFHTCFVLKALAKIERLTGCPDCTLAIERGLAYYTTHLLDEQRLPKPFSVAPRLTVYRRELYDYAEAINLAQLLRNRSPQLDSALPIMLEDLLCRWQKPDGSFRSRQLLVGWDNTPMHRWAQSQIFRSLSFFLFASTTHPVELKAQVQD